MPTVGDDDVGQCFKGIVHISKYGKQRGMVLTVDDDV